MLGDVNKLFVFKSLLTTTSNICLYTSSKLSCPYFKFSLKMKVMGLNAGCLLKYFLLYICIKAKKIAKAQRSLKHLICEPCPALDITTINLETSFDVISERVRDHSSITSSKRWVGGVRIWQFLIIYSTVNHGRL